MRKNALTLLIGLLSLTYAACGPKVVSDEDDEPCDGSETFCGTDTEGKNICVDLTTNASHCGSCFGDCREPQSNTCMGGLCACSGGDGNVSDECDGDTVCVGQTGQCILPDYGATDTCDPIEGTGCEDVRTVCADGYCTVPDCDNPETCNALDDDCNGHLDGTGPEPGQRTPLSLPCYSGPPGTEDFGICRGGAQLCVGGRYATTCSNEQTPVDENGLLRCDGIDNDCNNCADNHWNEEGVCEPLPPLKADIVFIIDRSGSMGGTIAAVVSTVRSWAIDIGTNSNIRFALINPTTIGDPDLVTVTQSLTTYSLFNTVMNSVVADGSSIEPMHYATQLVLNGSLDASLGFAPDAIRIVIAVHDEPATDSSNVVSGYDEATVCGAVPSNTILAVITAPLYFADWDLCTSSTDMPPTAMPLTSDPATMLANLNLIIETPCF